MILDRSPEAVFSDLIPQGVVAKTHRCKNAPTKNAPAKNAPAKKAPLKKGTYQKRSS